MKRLFGLFMAGVMLFSIFLAGCGASENPENTAQSTNAEQPATSGQSASELETTGEGGLPLSKEPAELRIMTFDNWYAPASYAQNLPVWQEMEKRTNVKIKWEISPVAQTDTVIKTTLASGEDLPDVIFWWLDLPKLYEQGLIIDLKPLIDKYAPNIKKLLDENPLIKGTMTQPTGEILFMSEFVPQEDFQPCYQFRQDWLEKVGKNVPTTTDELIDVWKAFRDNDPNGNNKKDEVPFTVQAPYWFDYYMAGSFDTYPSHMYYPDAGGKIEYVPITEGYREFLRFLGMLYGEKLLDQSYASLTNDKYISMMNSNILGSNIDWMQHIEARTKSGTSGTWVGAPIVKGPKGVQYLERRDPFSGNTVITKSCKDPVLAIKYMDYLMSDEGIHFYNWGVEGKSYNLVDGKPQFTDYVMNNPDKITDPLRALGALWNMTGVLNSDMLFATSSDTILKLNDENKKILVDPNPAGIIPATREEGETATKYATDIETYRVEMRDKFIMGKASLDSDWDAYVNKMKELNIDKLIEINQAQYDRFKAVAGK